jgi:hypothetical protein
MQTKYRARGSKLPGKEVSEGRKIREQTVNTKNFVQRQKFGAASKVRHIDIEEYLSMRNEVRS